MTAKRKRFKTRDEEMEALRREPVFRALVRELESQTSERRQVLEDWLTEETGKEKLKTPNKGDADG